MYNRQAFPDPRTPLSQSLHYSEVVMLVGLIQAKLSTEVQGLSFVCSTSEVYYPYALWNIQNLGAVPPYDYKIYIYTVRGEKKKKIL